VGGFDTEVGGDSLHGLLYLEQRFDALKHKYAPKEKFDKEKFLKDIKGKKGFKKGPHQILMKLMNFSVRPKMKANKKKSRGA
jgi:hypothetical protein